MRGIKAILSIIVTSVMLSCSVDDGYHLFVNPPEPDRFEVTAPAANMTICDLEAGNTNINLTVRAMNNDGEQNLFFKKKVKMVLLDTSTTPYTEMPVNPQYSPNFTKGSLSITDLGASGITPDGGPYQLKVTHEKYADITGQSGDLVINLTEMPAIGAFAISKPPKILNEVPFRLTIIALDQNGAPFPSYDGYVNIEFIMVAGKIGTFSHTLERLIDGRLVIDDALISGADATTIFSINITHAAASDQAADMACDGGLEPGGGGTGGEEGGSIGGTGGISDPSAVANIECELKAPTEPILKGSTFQMTLNMIIKDQFENPYNEYSGNVVFSSSPTGTLSYTGPPASPAARDFTGVSYSQGDYAYDTAGDITITATVTGTDVDPIFSLGQDTSCTADITVITGIGIFGDSATALKALLESDPILSTSYNFRVISTMNNTISAYSGIIINFAGKAWVGGGELSLAQATVLNTYWSSGKPIIIAHDSMRSDVIGIFGIADADRKRVEKIDVLDPVLTGNNWGTIGLVKFDEKYWDLFPVAGGTNQVLMTTVPFPSGIKFPIGGGVQYSLVKSFPASGSKGNAVISSEAIYHLFAGEDNVETQWWDDNEPFVQEMILWTFQ